MISPALGLGLTWIGELYRIRVYPTGVEYIRVLRLRDDLYPQTLANLPAWVQANPGSVWVVGNEPDTTYGGPGRAAAGSIC